MCWEYAVDVGRHPELKTVVVWKQAQVAEAEAMSEGSRAGRCLTTCFQLPRVRTT